MRRSTVCLVERVSMSPVDPRERRAHCLATSQPTSRGSSRPFSSASPLPSADRPDHSDDTPRRRRTAHTRRDAVRYRPHQRQPLRNLRRPTEGEIGRARRPARGKDYRWDRCFARWKIVWDHSTSLRSRCGSHTCAAKAHRMVNTPAITILVERVGAYA